MAIIDRRTTNKNKSVGNRQKFIERNKKRIKHSIDEITVGKGITDAMSDRKVTVDGVDEPSFGFDMSTGQRDAVLPGNKNLQKGDRINQPPQSQQGGGKGEDGEDSFSFTLSKEEFLDLYFSDLCLPNFIKESLKDTVKFKLKRAGYTKDGVPARLDLVKSLKQAMARRIATKSERYLDDVDLRYKLFVKHPYPIKQATMILLMDVSGSMGEYEKNLAKKFFLLLYLFLNKCYNKVEVIFISHTTDAREVDEQEFFYGKNSGGTIVSSGLKLVNEIIDKRIDLTSTNVYIAQASDGDMWGGEDETDCPPLMESLLSKVQYFAYIQTEDEKRLAHKKKYGHQDLMTMYEDLATRHKNLQARHVIYPDEVYPVLRSLFEKGK